MVKRKHQPPAKKRYDDTHPVVSVRVDLPLKQKLEEIKKMSGKSVGDILREAVKVQSLSVKNAFTLGKNKAKSTYGVSYKCFRCGGTKWVETLEERKAAAQYMRDNGWGHRNCVLSKNSPFQRV
ncbi:ribbon-helix-helix domain-containing protein [Chloroflexota bacterium]